MRWCDRRSRASGIALQRGGSPREWALGALGALVLGGVLLFGRPDAAEEEVVAEELDARSYDRGYLHGRADLLPSVAAAYQQGRRDEAAACGRKL